ncbi:hypothetical protein LJR030_002869 [Rhizobium sp. LjRoot30]|uniref:hypothetical protein n=1 Tax=Rhizobium sp. LjRoot30 TaxID=3342320 RepID=UPI003ED086D4
MRTKMQALRAKANKVVKLMIEEEHQPLVTEVEGNIASMVRKNTDGAYLLGQQLARVKAVLPEKTFGKWVKQRCGYTPRQARYYIAIHEHLQAFRDRLVAAGVLPTVLFVLSSAELEKIEAVLAAFERGERLTVGQVKLMVKPLTDAPEKSSASGGAAGLRRAVEARVKVDLGVINKLVKRSLKAVELLVTDIRKGKHVAKTKLAAAVETDCQKAGILLSGVISPRGSDAPLAVEWEKARQTIARLGDSPRYPGREEFADWLVEQVLPALRFVVHGEALPGIGIADKIAEVSSDSSIEDQEAHAVAPALNADPAMPEGLSELEPALQANGEPKGWWQHRQSRELAVTNGAEDVPLLTDVAVI